MEINTYQHLGKKAFWIFVIKRSEIVFVFLTITILFIIIRNNLGNFNFLVSYDYVFTEIIFGGFIISILSIGVAFLIAWLEYIRFKFMLGENVFRITRGVLTKHETSLPYRFIKSVDIKQSLLYQIMGASRITIETIIDTGSESDFKPDSEDEVFPAIDKHLALMIQKELTERANTQKIHVSQSK